MPTWVPLRIDDATGKTQWYDSEIQLWNDIPPNAINHNDTENKQGGTTNEYYHLTSTEASGLTSGGDADSFHGHASLSMMRFGFSFTGININPLSSYTAELNLGVTDRQYGIVMLHIPNSASGSNKRLTCTISCGRTLNDGYGHAGDEEIYSVYGYLFRDWRIKGFSYSLDSVLSDASYGSASKLQISSCYIDNDKLKITFYNTLPSSIQSLHIVGVFHTWK